MKIFSNPIINRSMKDLNKAKDAYDDNNLTGAVKYYLQACSMYNSWRPMFTTRPSMNRKQLMRIQHMTRNVGMTPVASENIRSATHVQKSDNQMSQNNANTVNATNNVNAEAKMVCNK